jgi:transposase
MLIPGNRLRVYVSSEPCDMRRSYDGLCGAVREVLKLDPLSGHLFCFFNRRRTQVKVLYWDTSGYCIWSKRLVRGCFTIGTKQELMLPELQYLLDGIDVSQVRRAKRFEYIAEK